MKNLVTQRSLLSLQLLLGLLTDLCFIPFVFEQMTGAALKSSQNTNRLDSVLLLLTFFSLVVYFFNILYFHYQLKYLLLLLLPLVGGLIFSVSALKELNKVKAIEFEMNTKLWAFFALLGLLALDQSSASIFTLWAFKTKLTFWQSMLDVLFLAATIFYFVYWGKKRGIAKWSLKNLLSVKWLILSGLILMITWSIAYPLILSSFHLSLPLGDNQGLIDQAAINTPNWLMWLHLALGAPIMEETIFRAGIYELLLTKQPKLAFVISALSFATVHMLNGSFFDWRVWGVYLGMGFILSGLYYKTRQLEASVALHFLWNGVWSYLSVLVG